MKNDFAQDLSPVEKEGILFAAQSPTAGAALGGTISTAAWKTKPSWYLVATSDRAIQADLQKTMAKTIVATTIAVDPPLVGCFY